MKMKVLHIMPFSIFAVNYVNAFNERDKDEHMFWLYGYDKSMEIERNIFFNNDRNIIRVEFDYGEKFERYYKYCEIFVIQCIPENYELLEVVKKYHQNMPKPYILVPWGRDCDRTSDIYQQDKSIWMPIDKIKEYLVQNSNYILATRKAYKLLEDNYKANAPRVFFNSLYAFNSEALYVYRNNRASDKKINVLVGHRGTKTSKHLDIFHMIAPYKREISKVFCPLSYGEKKYIKRVKKVGFITFLNRFKTIDKWMPKNEYIAFLNENIDVGIFGGQLEGATTIYELAYMGKKLYLSEDSEMSEILDDIGVIHYKISTVGIDKSFATLLSDTDIANNIEKMKRYGDKGEFYKCWDNLLQACNKNGINGK